MTRVAIGGIVHETHTFAEVPTTLADFDDRLHHIGATLMDAMRGTRSAIGGMLDAATDHDWEVLPTVYATAMPSGIVTDDAYTTLLGELLDGLRAAQPVDAVLLALHGAMVTAGELDTETHILSAVRGVVGSETPIVVVLDMHGNISPRTVELASVLIAFDKNPHTDPYERGTEAVALLHRLLTEPIQPTAAYAFPRVMLAPQATGTDDLPLRAVHERAAEMEADERVLCVAVMGGFAYADTPHTGASVIVTTHDNPTLAQAHADELADILFRDKDAALPEIFSPADAVKRARATSGHPIILVDSADNIGGGTPGDGTDILRAMLAQDAGGAVVLADAEAVRACHDAGSGATLTLTVGGKTDSWHGEPIKVTGTVQALSDGVFRCELPDNHFAAFYGDVVHMGPSAWLRVGAVNILLTTHKTPPFDLGQLRHIGIMPEEQPMIAVKSAVAYRAAYIPIAAGAIEVDTAGLCSANLARFPYQNLTRPIFPLDNLNAD